jgi:hypothetical protein
MKLLSMVIFKGIIIKIYVTIADLDDLIATRISDC